MQFLSLEHMFLEQRNCNKHKIQSIHIRILVKAFLSILIGLFSVIRASNSLIPILPGDYIDYVMAHSVCNKCFIKHNYMELYGSKEKKLE